MEMDFEDLQGKVVDATFAALPPKQFTAVVTFLSDLK